MQAPDEGPPSCDDELGIGYRDRALRRFWQGGCGGRSGHLGGVRRRRSTRDCHHVHARRDGCGPSRFRCLLGLHLASHGPGRRIRNGLGLVDRVGHRRRGRGDRSGVNPCRHVADSTGVATHTYLPGRPDGRQPARGRPIRGVRVLVRTAQGGSSSRLPRHRCAAHLWRTGSPRGRSVQPRRTRWVHAQWVVRHRGRPPHGDLQLRWHRDHGRGSRRDRGPSPKRVPSGAYHRVEDPAVLHGVGGRHGHRGSLGRPQTRHLPLRRRA